MAQCAWCGERKPISEMRHPDSSRGKTPSTCHSCRESHPDEAWCDFHATAPNRLWVTDITEFSIPAGKVYLSPVIDCHDGMPVAWTIGTSPNAALANGMLRDACATPRPGETPIIHSD